MMKNNRNTYCYRSATAGKSTRMFYATEYITLNYNFKLYAYGCIKEDVNHTGYVQVYDKTNGLVTQKQIKLLNKLLIIKVFKFL